MNEGAKRSTAPSAAPPMRPFADSLPMLLLRARAAVMERFRPLHVARGLTEQQWRILRVLFDAGELDANRLAAAAHLLGPSLSRILPPLEARGLVRRRLDAADQRRNMISLLPAGRRTIVDHGPRSEAAYARIERQFGEARLRRLYAELRALEAVLGEDAAPVDSGRTAVDAAADLGPSEEGV